MNERRPGFFPSKWVLSSANLKFTNPFRVSPSFVFCHVFSSASFLCAWSSDRVLLGSADCQTWRQTGAVHAQNKHTIRQWIVHFKLSEVFSLGINTKVPWIQVCCDQADKPMVHHLLGTKLLTKQLLNLEQHLPTKRNISLSNWDETENRTFWLSGMKPFWMLRLFHVWMWNCC